MDNLTLLRMAKRGNAAAREALVKNNSSLVWSIAYRFSNRGYDTEDIFQIGCIGMVKAISQFDPDYGVRFSTYAVPLIIGEIKKFLRDDGLIKVSRNLKTIAAKASDIREKYVLEKGVEPTVSELCAILQTDRDTLIMAMESAKPVCCLDSPCANGSNTTISDTVCDDLNINEKMVDSLSVRMAISKLSEEEKEFIHMRYFQEKTQSEIARRFNVSQVQICRREKKILQKLKDSLSV